MKKRYTLIVISVWLIFLITACAKQESKQMVTPFENTPISAAKSIEFSNYTIRSENKELGRTKTVTKKQDMESIVKYIKTLSCTKSTQETNGGDYSIRLRDDTGKYIYSIQVSKNQLCLYERGTDTAISVYEYKDTKLIDELERVYKDINYKEVFIIKK
ncbi:hypothetical protein LGL08_06105 [Clostridium estertheticum]|uniref:hypothetical protein n=1 Tax=Clostridium estertheticum TaxID=238834 RepID=UPI001CF5B419|nr:hypothetical protein [Clostridium estertheticum]MCB2305893.1 hypothetical protein [Clostridium estertheticum]MCB2345638.1 hypothetical protein [Clostridium estertheticum]MCB2349135.1 hypothetical protein [Clostridium estertheticum]WAG47769.1 hypothetical protein LL127_10145 [Clostridium estertheticum]